MDLRDLWENFKFTLYNRENICYTMQSLNGIGDTCQWRSWIARWTPTPKVAGSNPVWHTKPPENPLIFRGFVLFQPAL